MYNLDDIIRIYFKRTSAREVLENRVNYKDYPLEVFGSKAMMYMKRYSDTENAGLYDYARGYLHTRKYNMDEVGEFRREANVFEALGYFAEKMLVMQNNKVVCKYPKFVRWREVTKLIGETAPICAFLALRAAKKLEKTTNFQWGITIGHNNVQLNKVLQKGVADNHFHLWGSAPVFELIWLKLMNHVNDSRNYVELKKIDECRRTDESYNSLESVKGSLPAQCLQAAFLRIILSVWVMGEEKEIDSKKLFERYKYDESRIECLLKYPDLLWDEVFRIQQLIDEVSDIAIFEKHISNYDYNLSSVRLYYNEMEADNIIFAGERWMIYKVLEKLYMGEDQNSLIYTWLYAYILIKADMRMEIQQSNSLIGFENFSIYSRRKSRFLVTDFEQKQMEQEAIYGSMRTGNLKSLEIRITPHWNAYENAKAIRQRCREIEKKENGNNWYYVFHFIKGEDELQTREEYWGGSYRHYKVRRNYARQTIGIIEFRERYPQLAQKVLGIDAAAQEIGCRPEVFGPFFRKLGQHISCQEEYKVQQLKKTYHVGEDFLDIIDGLRAVEECIRFLDFQCGDRIGHGTVLGINVRKWYYSKNNTIIISKQDFLDNLVWLYYKLIEFEVQNCESLKGYLEREFQMYFSEIYLENVRDDKKIQFSMYDYYNAWKLRGDDPELYRDAWKWDKVSFDYWIMEDSSLGTGHKENDKIRTSISSVLLYYYYHYSWEVRSIGSEKIEIHFPQYYIEGVEAIQKAMQEFVGIRGIGIETNPSSNLQISAMTGYEEHPIVKFYNKDLTNDINELEECKQLCVSINTDDKGIFYTTVENEYAFLACALEKVKDNKGNYKYNRQMIYQWLDHIREMGIMQSFFDKCREDVEDGR